ncbi:MAG: TonB-dependent receptor [Acidobacteriota bacterium]
MLKQIRTIALVTVALAAAARADDGTQSKLPLDQLLETPISTGAKYDQQLSSVAASVTVITAEEIERYGWTSLADVLQATRGFYLTNDRNSIYAGLRGIGRPSDYNSRLLILIDGQTVNSTIFGAAPVGNDLALDLGMVEKIEIVRGPGSALYGTHAMLAVINVFTKNADAIDGVTISALGGSHGKRGAAVRAGKVLANGLRLTASGSWQETDGADLFFPEYDSPQTNHGVSEKLDYEDLHGFRLTLEKGGFKLSASTRTSTKGLPTASFDTVFNADSSASWTDELVVAEYRRKFGRNATMELRSYWDHGHGTGVYPYDVLGIEDSFSSTVGGEARLHLDLSPNHRLTAGGEYATSRPTTYGYVAGDFKVDLRRPYDVTSYYLQYEGHPSPRLGFVAGIRRDHFSATADAINPRAAILFTPNRSTTLKLLYGSAFRSPNVYESFYEDSLTPWKAHPDLKPETIRTTELVWEQRLSPETLLVGSAFRINADNLIDEELEPVDQIYWYNNVGSMKSNGVELGLNVRRTDGVWAHLSGSAQRAATSEGLTSNSPRFLLKGGLSTSPWAPLHAGIEGIFEASRRTRDGDKTDPFLLLNGVVSKQLGKSLRLALTVRNLLDGRYSTPVGPELLPQAIRQDGRTLMLKMTYER